MRDVGQVYITGNFTPEEVGPLLVYPCDIFHIELADP